MKILSKSDSLTKKLRLLEQFMEKNGIGMLWNGTKMIIIDKEKGNEAFVTDNEIGISCSEFPCVYETRLIRCDLEH